MMVRTEIDWNCMPYISKQSMVMHHRRYFPQQQDLKRQNGKHGEVRMEYLNRKRCNCICKKQIDKSECMELPHQHLWYKHLKIHPKPMVWRRHHHHHHHHHHHVIRTRMTNRVHWRVNRLLDDNVYSKSRMMVDNGNSNNPTNRHVKA